MQQVPVSQILRHIVQLNQETVIGIYTGIAG